MHLNIHQYISAIQTNSRNYFYYTKIYVTQSIQEKTNDTEKTLKTKY